MESWPATRGESEREQSVEVAVIGAGVSGLAAAHVLRDHDLKVALYEREERVGGRATTRSRAGFRFDPGAQYIHGNAPVSDALLLQRFATSELVSIAKPVWTFDSQNRIREGDPRQNALPRWTYRHGLLTLAELMARELTVYTHCEIARLAYMRPGWRLFSATGQVVAEVPAVLVTLPAPEAAALIAASELPPGLQQTLLAELGRARYRPLLSLALAWPRKALPPTPYYALVNSDKTHPISWLAREEEKSPERVPPAWTLLIVQLAPDYSRAHWSWDDQALAAATTTLVSALLGQPLPAPHFYDVQRWPLALPEPERLLDAETLHRVSAPYGLFFSGDAFTGGRVHLALAQGQESALRLLASHR
ncbi:FAD-dependent oxidoreductase [Thermogemmatispora aurantia]|jgi:renalase|uniref:FAD-dependent oxidoreductase n=1 Tax=Thermogemmatispora aurantia TaxID=2045279 RepID=A0A5J4K624_9CHLR|nr:FAD-dependent oxidoreductase [Thermogemmatispora aurantia]GER82129.1 FAD-dependent oxidoreductase [Thermogemmatispora aurantia]